MIEEVDRWRSRCLLLLLLSVRIGRGCTHPHPPSDRIRCVIDDTPKMGLVTCRGIDLFIIYLLRFVKGPTAAVAKINCIIVPSRRVAFVLSFSSTLFLGPTNNFSNVDRITASQNRVYQSHLMCGLRTWRRCYVIRLLNAQRPQIIPHIPVHNWPFVLPTIAIVRLETNHQN